MSPFLIISTTWAVVALALLIVAWRLARIGRTGLHRNIMVLLTIGAWIFIVNYIFLQRYNGDLGSFPREYVPWMAVHGSLGLIPGPLAAALPSTAEGSGSRQHWRSVPGGDIRPD